MKSILDWILRRNDPPPFDYEKAVGKYLLELPRCSRKIVVASPKYDSEHYFGEVLVDAVGLIPWAEHHSTACWSSWKEDQAARLALPVWIRGADPSDELPTYLLEPFMRVLLCNLRDIRDYPPADWTLERKGEYFDWAKNVVDGLRGCSPALELIFDQLYLSRQN